ncbi:glycoprotein integral membrane protein 1 isoform X3 [Latimeria chalumnae]|uniref:glycoprotein integral membrane protein 1 isoform X3 n=1 Tax=Latimeria chalumnae TaxID=7897 RepID=UPI00313CAD92
MEKVVLLLAVSELLLVVFIQPVVGATRTTSDVNKKNITINVTTLEETGERLELQVVLHVTYVSGEVYVNNLPVKHSGVTRLNCKALLLENGNPNSTLPSGHLGVISIRILVRDWPLETNSDLQLIVIQEEVTEVEGKQVYQTDVTEMEILVNKDLRELRHLTFTVPLKETMLYTIPRDNDILFTLPNFSGKDAQGPVQTTSHYPIRQVETTVDEESGPVKLPETPLRAEPPSSYKVMCQWIENLRKKLCKLWLESLPLFFSVMEVVVVGVVGSAIIIKVLKVLFPSCEHNACERCWVDCTRDLKPSIYPQHRQWQCRLPHIAPPICLNPALEVPPLQGHL